MKKAELSDKEKVVKIICESFNTNPHVNYILKKDEKRDKRLAALSEYAFYFGMRRNGVYLTDDGQGVSIIFEYNKVKMNFYDYWRQLILIFKCFTVSRAYWVYKVEKQIKLNRASNVNFLYLWFFGVTNETLGTSNGRDMMKFIFDMSLNKKLPIYLETSLRRNSVIYKRYGFEEYNVFETEKKDLTMWYLKRPYDHQL
jgi:hypothetical protein